MGQSISSLVFIPPNTSSYPSSFYSQFGAFLWLKTPSNYYFPALFINRKASITLLFSHGNAEDLSQIADRLYHLSLALNVNIFCYDYIGYGESRHLDYSSLSSTTSSTSSTSSSSSSAPPNHANSESWKRERKESSTYISSWIGTKWYKSGSKSSVSSSLSSSTSSSSTKTKSPSPSESLAYDCIDAVFAYLRDDLKFDSSSLVLYGRSLGSGPTIHLASRLGKSGIKIGGIILQSALLSIYRVVLPLRFNLPYDLFVNISKISSVSAPVFLIHGTCDEVVPFSHSLDLFSAIPEQYRVRPLWINGASHNNIEFFYRKEEFFYSCLYHFLTLYIPRYLVSNPFLFSNFHSASSLISSTMASSSSAIPSSILKKIEKIQSPPIPDSSSSVSPTTVKTNTDINSSSSSSSIVTEHDKDKDKKKKRSSTSRTSLSSSMLPS